MIDERNTVTPQPSLFVGHGAPDLLLSKLPARKFLKELGQRFPQPRGSVVISAHWSASSLQITPAVSLETIYDFSGWPPELYQMKYKASGADWLNNELTNALNAEDFTVSTSPRKGMDHGAWVPLSLMYPQANIPVVQLSLVDGATPEQYFAIGQALDSLRQNGVLVLASGGLVHNLRAVGQEGMPPEAWAKSFDNWLKDKMGARKLEDLLNYSSNAPHARKAHPTDEHLMPLFVAMGAGWSDGKIQQIHSSFCYRNISMASYSFAEQALN